MLVVKDILLKLMCNILKIFPTFTMIYPLCLKKKRKIKNIEKFVCNLDDKEECVISIRNLKPALNHGLVLKQVHIVIKFNQKTWLKLYADMSTELRKNAKYDFEKDFFKLVNNAAFAKILENVTKYKDIKLVTTGARRNYLVSEANYHSTFFFSVILLAIEMKKHRFI